MATKPYLIATPRIGLERDMEPEWLPNDAYPDLEDSFMFRGRIQRRRGFQALGRLVTTVGAVTTFNLLPVMGLRSREIAVINEEQLVAFDTAKANVYSNFAQTFQDVSFYKTSGTALSWTGSNSDFFWTTNYLNAFFATNNVKGFQDNWNSSTPGRGDGIRWYDGTGWVNFLPAVDGTPTYLMGALILVSYRNRLVALSTTEGTAIGASNTFLQRARWSQNGTIYPNTDPLGNVTTVPAGYTGGKDNSAWRSDVVGKGGFIDAPTQEQIISAEFYKDTLIVFFERSTWQLRYTGNETLPFIWERINVDFGAESTFSMVPFDSGIIAVGNYGIITCDATGVKRIDQIIPDEVFKIHNGNDGVKRVYGIRDYSQQLVYWTFPSEDENPTFPNRILIYNYLDGSYSFFNDSFTCFGYYQPFNDTTWNDLNKVKWGEFPYPWNNGDVQSDFPEIVAGNQQGFVFRRVNGGPIMNSDPSFYISGASQAATCIITSPDHNLLEGQIIVISDVVGMVDLNGGIYRVSKPINANTFAIQDFRIIQALGARAAPPEVKSGFLNLNPGSTIIPGSVIISDTVTTFLDNGLGVLVLSSGVGANGTINYTTGAFTVTFNAVSATNITARYGTDPTTVIWYNVDSTGFSAYASSGFIKVRNNYDVISKRFNPFLDAGMQLRMSYIDMLLQGTSSCEFTLNIFVNENSNTPVETYSVLPITITGQDKVWYRTYTQSIAQFIQFELTFSDAQIVNPNKSDEDVVLHAMIPWFAPCARLTYGNQL